MKIYTVVVHYLQMCMKEYGCCPKFRRGDNSTYTSTKRGVVQLLLNGLLDFWETLYSCSTLPADVHEGIWFLSKIGFHSLTHSLKWENIEIMSKLLLLMLLWQLYLCWLHCFKKVASINRYIYNLVSINRYVYNLVSINRYIYNLVSINRYIYNLVSINR